MKVDIKLNDGAVAKVEIPFSAWEMTFSQFCEFREIEQKMFEFRKEGEHNKSLLCLAELLQVVIIASDDFWNEVEVGEYNDKITALQPNKDITLWDLYLHIVNIINTFQPEFLKYIQIGKDKYLFNTSGIEKSIKGENSKLTTRESIEVQELHRKFNALKGSSMGDAQINFELGLREMAIFMRKKDEKLPFQVSKFEKFINERAKLFSKVALGHFLNTRFFFQMYLMTLAKEKIVSTISNNRQASELITPPILENLN